MASVTGDWIAKLRCPRCAGRCSPPTPRCDACGFEYPSFGGIACVVTRPHELVLRWRARLHEAARALDDARARIVAELATTPRLHPLTRARLERLHVGVAAHRMRLLSVLGEAGITPLAGVRAEPSAVQGEDSITSYYHQIHRDWGWDAEGSRENADAFAEIAALLDGAAPLGDTLVIGAGACRLSSDVHDAFGGGTTVAIDINPLPLVAARRVLAG